MKRLTTTLVAALAAALSASPALAGESSVLETAINIPDGPASIEGFGQGYDVSPSSGLPSLSYPISVPPGRVGLQPSLSLNYEAGGGSGLYGLGWSMGAPSIELSLREGIPLYSGSDQLTLRGLGASEELIEVAPGEYREEIEGATPVIVRQSGEGFEAWTTSGMRYVFGTTAEARTQGPNGTFAWKLEAMIDTLRQTQALVLRALVDGQSGAMELWQTATLRELSETGDPEKSARSAGGERWVSGSALGLHDFRRPKPKLHLRKGAAATLDLNIVVRDLADAATRLDYEQKIRHLEARLKKSEIERRRLEQGMAPNRGLSRARAIARKGPAYIFGQLKSRAGGAGS